MNTLVPAPLTRPTNNGAALAEKLEVLAASARYDVSCASSGSRRAPRAGGVGNAAPSGICHTWSADGRCVSLLKVLFTNYCIYDCAYCLNRRSNDLPRAMFTPVELADLTIGFYRRNYIEGLFLSSGVWQSPDATMELLLQTVRLLRDTHRFNGYIHLKAIPGADARLLHAAGRLVDRLSVNIELPSHETLGILAPDKTRASILTPMARIRDWHLERQPRRGAVVSGGGSFVPAGQSTQLIVGASPEDDRQILTLSSSLYDKMRLRRVYYSAYVPVNRDSRLPAADLPPLLREHRLYQADWLLRFYEFSVGELFGDGPGRLDAELDPKVMWALRNLHRFPVEVNRADYEVLLRVPGLGVTSARRIVQARRVGRLTLADLPKLGVVLKRARYFVTADGAFGGSGVGFDPDAIRRRLLVAGEPVTRPRQLTFADMPPAWSSTPEAFVGAVTGQF